jgi:hypothetical protein
MSVMGLILAFGAALVFVVPRRLLNGNESAPSEAASPAAVA